MPTNNIMKDWEFLKFPEANTREKNLAQTLQQTIAKKHGYD